MSYDQQVRQKAFEFITNLVDIYEDAIPRTLLEKSFEFDGTRVPLLAPQGIFKPRILDFPLTIATSPNSPYDDTITPTGLKYRYRGKDPMHRDNVGLRNAKAKGLPLIYLHGLVPGKYLACWPVYIIGDEPHNLTFTVAVDSQITFDDENRIADVKSEMETEIRRRYVTTETRVRLHQRTFRERVIRAYKSQCAMCRLRHEELLDAAHIVPDADEKGEPVVSNGISLCKIHHAAFDRGIVGIRPDLVIEIRNDILIEIDGPMLKYGLQQMHGQKLLIPGNTHQRPDLIALDSRYSLFRAQISGARDVNPHSR